MKDPHHNIFYAYRGAALSEEGYSRQLENNTTKALINVLELASPSLCKTFLAFLGISANPPFSFCMQRVTPSHEDVTQKQQRVLLGISPTPTNLCACKIRSASIFTGTLPDAWICSAECAVLVESKVVGDLTPSQCNGHLMLLGEDGGIQQPIFRTWKDIYRFLKKQPQNPAMSDKDGWLKNQLMQYLELIGLSGYAGFNENMFAYFGSRSDEDMRRRIRIHMADFGELVNERLQLPFYDQASPGNFGKKDDYCWVALGPEAPAYRRLAHQTIALCQAGLRVFVNVELKVATDKLKHRLAASNQGFWQVIEEIAKAGPFEVIIMERVHQQAQKYDLRHRASFSSRELLDPEGRKRRELHQWIDFLPYPNFMLERKLWAGEVATISKQNPESLAQRVAEMVKSQHPLVEFINED